MTIIVSTCDRYDHLLPGFAMQWNQYWGADVTVLGFRQPPVLSANFTFVSMGVENMSWSAHLRQAIAPIDDDRILLLFDDYWLMEPVDSSKVERMNAWLDDQDVIKADLSRNTEHFSHHDLGNGFIEAAQDAQYRTSTQPCIWRKSHLLRLLGTGEYNPWQFELQVTPDAKCGRVIGTHEQLVTFANVYYKGAPHCYMIEKISASDLAALQASGAMDAFP